MLFARGVSQADRTGQRQEAQDSEALNDRRTADEAGSLRTVVWDILDEQRKETRREKWRRRRTKRKVMKRISTQKIAEDSDAEDARVQDDDDRW